LLKQRGYATAHIGKWHLGHLPQYLPTRHGFDSYFGIPYSNDMDWTGGALTPEERRRLTMNPKIEYWNVPLLRNKAVIERPAEQATLTRRYTDEAFKFIKANGQRPFFLYLAHTMPHMPLFRSKEFAGRSPRGVYGAEAYGFRVEFWSSARVGEVIWSEFEVRYHKNHIPRLLHELGWTPQMPIERAAQRDEARITKWRDEAWPKLKKKPGVSAERVS